jgi:hypothetical protein
VTNAQAGSCNLIAQNCGGNFTCTIQQDGASWRTACTTLGNGTLGLGATCASHSQCAPGLRCTLEKCTRPCCPALEAQLCGTGQCDLQITFPGSIFLQVCSFSPPCTPWANDCPPGRESDCHIGSGNKFTCTQPTYNQDAGSTLGDPCVYLNDCDDSQHCIYPRGASSGTCRWLCKVNNAGGAPDSGTVGGAPGQGGCPTAQSCVAFSSPTWLGYCN